MGLLLLPHDLDVVLCAFLLPMDVAVLRGVSKGWRASASASTVWRSAYLRDFDDARDGGAASLVVLNPLQAYAHRVFTRGVRSVQARLQGERQRARAAARSLQTLTNARILSWSLVSWVFLPAPCAFLFVLLVGLRADGRVDWPWPAVFVPLLILTGALTADVAVAAAVWRVAALQRWSPFSRAGPPLPAALRGPPAAHPLRSPPPLSEGHAVGRLPPPGGAAPPPPSTGAALEPRVDVSLSPWATAKDALAGSPPMLCIDHVTGPWVPGVAFGLLLFALAACLIVALAGQVGWVGAGGAPSWGIAFLPLWLILALAPLGCCLCLPVRRSNEGPGVLALLLLCVGLPLLTCAVPLAVALDQHTTLRAGGGWVPLMNTTGVNATTGVANATAAGVAGNSTEPPCTLASPDLVQPLPLALALVPLWLIASALLLVAVGMSVTSCARFARATLTDLRQEFCIVQTVSFLLTAVVGAPLATLALLSAKADGGLQDTPWTHTFAPLLFLLAALSLVSLVPGSVECHEHVVLPCMREGACGASCVGAPGGGAAHLARKGAGFVDLAALDAEGREGDAERGQGRGPRGER